MYISVAAGLVPVSVPVNVSLGGNVTVSFSGSQVEVYDNVGKAVLSQAAFKSTDTLTIELPAGQANSVVGRSPQQRRRAASAGQFGPRGHRARRTTRSRWLGRAGPTRSPSPATPSRPTA